MWSKAHLEIDDADPLVRQMSAVTARTQRKVNAVGSELSFEEWQRRNTTSFADVERFDSPFSGNAVGESRKVRTFDISEPPIRDVTDVDLQREPLVSRGIVVH